MSEVYQTLSRHELEGLWRRQDRESLTRLRYLAWAGLYGWTALLYVDSLAWAVDDQTVLLPGLRIVGAVLIVVLLLALRRPWSSPARHHLVTITVWGALLVTSATAALAHRPGDVLVPLFAVAAVLRMQRGRWMSIPVATGLYLGVLLLTHSGMSSFLTVLWGAIFAGLVSWLLQRSDTVAYRDNLLIERQRVLLQDAHERLGATPAPHPRRPLRDPLTGVGDSSLLHEVLDRAWRRARRERAPLALLLVDIDHMGLFNALYGHEAGNEALRKVAEALQASLWRPADQVTRLEGQVFAVVLPGTDAVGARVVASRLRESVAGLGIHHDESPSGRVTVSLGGVATWPAEAGDDAQPSVMVDRASTARDRAKGAGRNRAMVDGDEE